MKIRVANLDDVDTIVEIDRERFGEYGTTKENVIKKIVPLNKDHPSIKNKVFEFWARNGYIKDGETAWIVNENEKVDCWIYRKVL